MDVGDVRTGTEAAVESTCGHCSRGNHHRLALAAASIFAVIAPDGADAMNCQHLPRLPQFDLRQSLEVCEAVLTQAETLQDAGLQRSLRRAGCELLDHALTASAPGGRRAIKSKR